ncbi:MAG: chaperone NapD [Rhodospirillales bacterium]|nr:chaperone NapD [Rhodospirillales bacterium]
MSISGLVVHARSEKLAGVKTALEALEGVEIHAANKDGRLVVTVDQLVNNEAADTLFKIREVDGVIDAALVYNYFDEDTVKA